MIDLTLLNLQRRLVLLSLRLCSWAALVLRCNGITHRYKPSHGPFCTIGLCAIAILFCRISCTTRIDFSDTKTPISSSHQAISTHVFYGDRSTSIRYSSESSSFLMIAVQGEEIVQPEDEVIVSPEEDHDVSHDALSIQPFKQKLAPNAAKFNPPTYLTVLKSRIGARNAWYTSTCFS